MILEASVDMCRNVFVWVPFLTNWFWSSLGTNHGSHNDSRFSFAFARSLIRSKGLFWVYIYIYIYMFFFLLDPFFRPFGDSFWYLLILSLVIPVVLPNRFNCSHCFPGRSPDHVFDRVRAFCFLVHHDDFQCFVASHLSILILFSIVSYVRFLP